MAVQNVPEIMPQYGMLLVLSLFRQRLFRPKKG